MRVSEAVAGGYPSWKLLAPPLTFLGVATVLTVTRTIPLSEHLPLVMWSTTALVAAVYAEGHRPARPDALPDSAILKAFLQLNPEEGFDIEALNSIDIRALEREVLRDKRRSREMMAMTEALLVRVREETENPILAGAILREKTLDWYRRSPSDPHWSEKMAIRWGGIFHESRTPGGRLATKLVDRLEALRSECAKAGGGLLSLRLRSRGRGAKRQRNPMMQQVAQAYLDDLTLLARRPDKPRGLERVSELARRIGPADVNIALGELFPREGGGPLMVLDPHYHPDEDATMIRPPPPRAQGEGVIYDLVQAKAPPPGEAPQMVPVEGATPMEDSPTSPWSRATLSKNEWNALLADLHKRKLRMEPPPVADYQERESYVGLRELLLADNSARKSFLAVHWKGRPSGLPLLARALFESTFVPEVETDGDYLEAELSRMAKDNPDSKPDDGKWLIGGGWNGWTVTREVADGVRTYRAKRRFLD